MSFKSSPINITPTRPRRKNGLHRLRPWVWALILLVVTIGILILRIVITHEEGPNKVPRLPIPGINAE